MKQRRGALATQKEFVESSKAWLPAFKLLRVGMLLGGITFLLATIRWRSDAHTESSTTEEH